MSLAVAKAAARPAVCPSTVLGGANARVLPVPMANIINGGKHADNKIDFQEFMVMPVGQIVSRSHPHGLGSISSSQERLEKSRPQYERGRRRRIRPNLDNEEAIKFILDAVDKAGYQASRDKDIAIALDTACSELFDEGRRKGYKFWKSAPIKFLAASKWSSSSRPGSRNTP